MNRSTFIGALYGRTIPATLAAITLLTTSTLGQDPPPTYDLSVVVRDFSKDHPDFNVVPAVGYGYYFGNVGFGVDAAGKPVFTGAGALAGRLWTDVNGKVIAPHLFNTCNFAAGNVTEGEPGASSLAMTVEQSVKVRKWSVVDSFDSNVGPYGGDNVGEAALIMANGTAQKDDDDDDDDDGDDDGDGHRGRYVELSYRSKVMGDVMVHPDDDPAKAVRVSHRSSVSGEVGNMESPAVIAAAELPVLDLGPSVGKVKHRRGDHELSEDLHCSSLKLDRSATMTVTGDVTIWCDKDLELDRGSILNIDGHVVIRCDREFSMDDESELRMMDGATLMLYVGRELELEDKSMLNMNTGNPQLVSIVMMTDPATGNEDRHKHQSKVVLDDGSKAAAWVHGVNATLKVDDRSEFFGSFVGRSVEVTDRSSFHVDMATGESTGGGEVVFEPVECELGDRPGTVVTTATGDVLSAETFSEWWRDVLGVNQSMVQTIRMTRNKFGIYFYLNDNYRPINGLLLGNEGDASNYHLTAEIDSDFTFMAGGQQWFEIRCTDDAYLFVNGRLVIDLGGYGFNKIMTADMERLGLTDGETYRLQLFHAQRQRGLAIFRLQTNMVLQDRGASQSVTGVLED